MKRMTREGAKDYASKIYKKQYWDVVGGDDLVPSPLDLVLFDISVNQGTDLALEIGAMAYDWRDAIILRSDSYDDKKIYGTYGKGWNKRIVSLRDYIITNYQVLEWDRKELLRAEK
jgi:lysozyme family protein